MLLWSGYLGEKIDQSFRTSASIFSCTWRCIRGSSRAGPAALRAFSAHSFAHLATADKEAEGLVVRDKSATSTSTTGQATRGPQNYEFSLATKGGEK